MTVVAGHMIAVVGSSPGVGKSTLCRAIARRAAASGATVDHFEEADILIRPDALLPFIPSPVAWGHDENAIAAVLADLEEAVVCRRRPNTCAKKRS